MKERISITLESELISSIDAAIDGTEIRNRSHAIEKILMASMGQSSKKKAVVFAGGEAISVGGKAVPKSMISVLGKPILWHLVNELKRNGIKDIILAIGDSGKEIEKHFGDGSRFGVRIQYIREDRELGTEGALLNIAGFVGSAPFFAMNGDQIFRMDLMQMYRQHADTNALATISLTTSSTPTRFGVMKMEGFRITEFVEKPKSEQRSTLVSTGTYIISPRALSMVDKPKERTMLEGSFFPRIAAEGRLYGYLHSGSWCSIDNIGNVEDSIKGMESEARTISSSE
jgi:NDP-sugar pyrophosphorylase family protein